MNATATNALRAVALLLAIAYASHSVWTSWDELQEFGGYDLRNRVVAARVLKAGMNPYTFVFEKGMPLEWADPVARPGLPRVTVPPSALLMYMPSSGLSFDLQRNLWWVLEWCALAGGCTLLALTLRTERGRLEFVVLALFIFAGGYFWHRHLVRGQYYVFEMMLLALSAWLRTRRSSEACSGVCLGLAIALRPTLAVAAVLLWLLRERRMALTAAGTSALCVLATLPWSGTQVWWSYLQGMQWHEQDIKPANMQAVFFEFPSKIEGVNPSAWLPDLSANLTFPAALRNLAQEYPSLAFLEPAALWAKAACAALLLAFALFLLKGRHRILRLRNAIALSFCCGLAVDYFLPVRWGYVDVVLLVPLALLWPTVLHRKRSPGLAWLWIGGLILGFALSEDLGGLFRNWLFGAGTFGILCLLLRRRTSLSRQT